MSNIPVAVQLFSLREETEKDFAGTLRKVADFGYDGVEFAGYGGMEAPELKELLDELGLRAAASHVPLDQLEDNLDAVIDYQKTIGSNYIVCPFLTEDRRSEKEYIALTAFLDKAGKQCREAGLTLCYHNHDFELEQLSDGRSALETIFEDTAPENVKTELDIYWLTKAGEDPVEWIKRYNRRAPLVHLKDMTTDDEKFFAELGTGGVNLEGVLGMSEEADIEWWVVEQDQSRRTPLESIEMSINYLKKQK
ncbi:sugar phosphate isomerase/epimerase family protein [Alteribacillus sp. HJP-4]|uniref:sugar phosphate isomerase/epimerase family protein n=1 Tax=Alteribacillus sp. HJP-4 TaxID=2775394 RepID=UPI0035CD2068